jgi:outer membrane lipoprotein LolB
MNSAPIVKISHLLLGALLLGLAGCVSQPTPPEPLQQPQINTLTKHQQQLQDLKRWQLKGRLAINYNGESWSASIHWQKSPEHYDIQLYLPLGQGSLQLRGDSDGATLDTSEGGHFVAESGESLFYQQFGLTFPIDALQQWVTGQPSIKMDVPGHANGWLQRVDSAGQMIALEQDNWSLRLLGYQQVTNEQTTAHPAELSLPQKIFMNQNGNSLRLVIQQWQLED